MILAAAALLTPTMNAIDQSDFERDYENLVRPYFETGEFGSFVGEAGVEIAYAAYRQPDAETALVILSGKSGSYLRYAEFLYDIRDWGYSVYIMDHRGMGLSGRMLDDPEKTYVDDFGNYVKDFGTFMESVVKQDQHEVRLLFAHSTGATVATLHIEQNPDDFAAAAFNGPLFDVNLGGVPEFVAVPLTGTLVAFGAGAEYAMGQGPWEFVPFDQNQLTHSEPRYRRWEDVDIAENPGITPGGVTNRWISQSLKYARKARWAARNINIPVLLFEAEDDAFANARGIDLFCRRASNCTRLLIPGSRHIIPIEVDSVRNEMLSQLRQFYREFGRE